MVRLSPTNYQPRLLLLQAEFARFSGDNEKAELLYDQTIREARERSDHRIFGLAGEIASQHYANQCKKKHLYSMNKRPYRGMNNGE